ncbi:MAG TPA: serine/threonine-protein kinase [Pyrinomonadaceae bacterium]|jgi:serine/threonine protein kinase
MENFDSQPGNAGNSVPQIIASNLRIENLLGRGGMGTVYRATHLTLDRVVAVKVINPEVAMNADVMQRFAREARLMAKLRHPRAAMIYDSGTLPDGRLFIVMEYVEGMTLADILKRDGKLPYKKAVDIAVSVCDVLSEAHSLGIIHRDLKPANIMLNNQGVFVLDFGIAKMLNTDNAQSMQLSMTGNGLLVGTPFYMSPEQCLGNPVEARSDLYSLGALLFEMIAGRPPFDDEVLSAVIIKHAMVEAPRIEEFAPDIPPALADVINRLLAKKPEDRPENASVTKAMLERSVAGASTAPALNLNTPTTTNTTAENIYPSTQQMNAVTASQMPQTLANTQSGTKENKSGGGLKIAAASAGAVILLGALAIGGFLLLKPNAATTSNGNMDSMANMDHSKHNMGDDFAKTPTDDKTVMSTQILSTEEADKIITEITRTTEHHADGMQIVKTPKDSALICLHNKIELGKTHMFAVERTNLNSPWEISARTSLDTPEFHGASWTFEPMDADGDGFEEVIYKGMSADGMTHKFLIYVPRTRQSYSIISATDASGKVTSTLSPNALVPNGAAFRKSLEQAAQGK